MTISINKNKKIPYINLSDGENLYTILPYFDKEKNNWCIITPFEDDINFLNGELEIGSYYNDEAVDDNDLFFRFYDYLVKYVNNQNISYQLSVFSNDFNNLVCLISKLNFYDVEKVEPLNLSIYVYTDFEYMILLLRSMFDTLQKIIKELLIYAKDDNNITKSKTLPSSFADVVMKKNEFRTREEINSKYGVPQLMLDVYIKYQSIFNKIKKIRDSIVHDGISHNTFFITNKGYGISKYSDLYKIFQDIWTENDYYNDNVVSLNRIFIHIISNTLNCYNDMISAYAQTFKVGESTIKGNYFIFHRSPFYVEFIQFLNGEINFKRSK